MAKELRYGMVGGSVYAFIGEVHRKAIAFDPRAELVCGCFSNIPSENEDTAKAYGVSPERMYADYREMAKAEAARADGIDFVSICTPNFLHYEIAKEMLNIKAESHEDLIVSLSGGNQQKVILARWLNTEAEILLLDNPTQGIDVGAKTEIYKLIQELAKAGKTVIVNTLEIPEIQKVADRCVVFYHGGVQAVLERSEITEERVMLLATNASAIRAEQGQEV